MGGIFGGGGAAAAPTTTVSTQQTSNTNVTTNVAVNPQIVNAIDATPLVGPFRELVAALRGYGSAANAAANVQKSETDKIWSQIQNWAAIASILGTAYLVFWRHR